MSLLGLNQRLYKRIKKNEARIEDLEEGIEKIHGVLENGKRRHKIPVIERIVEKLIEKKGG